MQIWWGESSLVKQNQLCTGKKLFKSIKFLEELHPMMAYIKTLTLVKIILKVRMQQYMEFIHGPIAQMVGHRNWLI